ncbi:MAG: fibronectin type III domain-containing protein [Nitrospirae bacterium]|nr:fibronectin type III domain-containing protein [Nitrospirota bacterium]
MCPITDNSITGNRTGIVIKDTAYGWLFSCRIENNDIYGNLDAGVYFQYGRESSILNNYIHDNTIGIRFADTVNNKIIGNSIENNTKGIVLTKLVCTDQNSGDTASTKWDTACPIPIVSGNQIYYNNIISNDTQVSDINRVCGDSDGCNTWYNSTLLEGNYWSNYTGLDNGYGGRIAGDGIGDTGIIPFPSAGYDNYPLVDKDKDETPDIFDNCPGISNPDQKDSNKNGKGDLCDTCPLCAWAPSNLTVTATYQSQINLSWKDNSTDEIDFRIYGKIDGDDAYERIGKVGANVTTYPHKSLQEYTTYYYRVRAYNGLVSSPYSNTVSATTRLNKPTALTATAVSASRINLSWTDNSSKEAGFEIQGKRGSTGTYSAIATVGPNVNSYANTGLVSKATYYYRVRAFNGTDDSAFSNAASATTQ